MWKVASLIAILVKGILQDPDTGMFSIGEYWNICGVPVLPLHFLQSASITQKLTILEHKSGLVLSNTCVPVSGTSVQSWNIAQTPSNELVIQPNITLQQTEPVVDWRGVSILIAGRKQSKTSVEDWHKNNYLKHPYVNLKHISLNWIRSKWYRDSGSEISCFALKGKKKFVLVKKKDNFIWGMQGLVSSPSQ